MKNLQVCFAICICASLLSPTQAQINPGDDLFDLSTPLISRSISAENTSGMPGKGGMVENHLGVGRKGAPNYTIQPGETYQMCNVEGPGTIRHIWITGRWKGNSGHEPLLRQLVVRAFWDDQQHPSIECPLGDFMGFAHAHSNSYQSAVHSVGKEAAYNFWLPMPFAKRSHITLTNESAEPCTVFYQIDYTLGDEHPEDVGRLHVAFRRENPTKLTEDFTILPQRTGKGRYLGAVLGVRTLHPGWWGEGEVKIYMDGDKEFPTICGTGSEDYVGLSYGMQQTPYTYHGCSLLQDSKTTSDQMDLFENKMVNVPTTYVSMYRWHLPDPIVWKKECRITIQQIGCCLYERDDDWSAAAFWYEPVPSEPLEPMPSKADRIADLEGLLQQ